MVNQIVGMDPDNEDQIFPMDWSEFLNEGATVATSSWIIPSGITKTGEGIMVGAVKTYVRLSEPTEEIDYIITNEITTSDGEKLQESGRVHVRESDRAA